MPNIHFLMMFKENSGFTNQLFSFVTGIISAIQKKSTIIVVHDFLMQYNDLNTFISSDKIFNFNSMNSYLKNKYNITLVSYSNFNYHLDGVFYGYGENVIDITNKVSNMLENKSFNSIAGDPCIGVEKELCIAYTVNGSEYYDIYREDYDKTIYFRYPVMIFEYMFGWINLIDVEMFNDILTHIVFNDHIQNIDISPRLLKKYNVIHIRNEEDAIDYWSNKNNMTNNEFEYTLNQVYINEIKKHIDPSITTLLLGNISETNEVVQFMKINNYSIQIFDKPFQYREMNAIFDFKQSLLCDNVFIGNFNFDHLRGSSFSYYICLMTKPIKRVLIDLDYILSNTHIY
jgi:hypothetical protein